MNIRKNARFYRGVYSALAAAADSSEVGQKKGGPTALPSERSEVLWARWSLPLHSAASTLTYMNASEEWTKDDELAILAETRQKLEAIEREWKMLRATSRATVIRLITQHGLSVAKASALSGHHRTSITVWLDIHNAENRAAQRAAAAGAAQDKK